MSFTLCGIFCYFHLECDGNQFFSFFINIRLCDTIRVFINQHFIYACTVPWIEFTRQSGLRLLYFLRPWCNRSAVGKLSGHLKILLFGVVDMSARLKVKFKISGSRLATVFASSRTELCRFFRRCRLDLSKECFLCFANSGRVCYYID